MKMRKLIAALICAIMCLAMLPAQAETISFYNAELTIDLPESWYVGTPEEGTSSELAVAFGLDQAGVDDLFTDMELLATSDTSGDVQLQVIIVEGMSGDMRAMTAADEETILQSAENTATSRGVTLLSNEIFRAPYTSYGKSYYDCGGYHLIQYSTIFGGKGYLFQLADYTGNPMSDETIALMDSIVASVVYTNYETGTIQVQNPFAQSTIPTVNVVSTPTSMEEIYVSDIGVTISVPTEWYTGLYIDGANSELATAFSLTDADIESMYNSGGYKISFFATPDMTGEAQLQIISTPGISLDMRDDNLNWDELMTGFLSTYDVGSIVESGRYEGGASNYVRAYTLVDNGSTVSPMLQYTTNIDSTIYIVQYFDYSVESFDADTIALIDSIVYNVTFD